MEQSHWSNFTTMVQLCVHNHLPLLMCNIHVHVHVCIHRLQIVQLDLLPVRSLPNKTPVIVEATLYHGATQLCEPCCTSPQPINGLLRVKETLTFNIAKKDVPKVK